VHDLDYITSVTTCTVRQ